MIEVIAVRHGETDWNRVRRLQGHTDVALNATGIEQAARLGAALADETLAAIHSSDLARALATARPIATASRRPVTSHALLRERNYGVLEGRTFPEILERHPVEAEQMRLRSPLHTIESGESRHTFFHRVVAAVIAIATAEQATAKSRGRADATILVVTHGGVLDMLHRAANGTALDAERACATPNAVVNRLAFDAGRFTIRSWGEAT